MRNQVKIAFIAVVCVTMISCGGFGGKEPSFQLSDLQGLWLEDKANVEHYVRFTDEKSDETPYLYGREWNADEDVLESDLYRYQVDTIWQNDSLYTLDSIVLPGNGWFKYKLEVKGDLEEIHLMDNGGAEIPKEYIVAMLTDDRLEYYEKDNKDRRTCFNKVVEAAN
ncbi:MAG: hypothetical protein K6A36_05170 [Paludibacteraceae bacterium]|nr:hypothetical protein [Paludibacteraceae bacterium]